MDWTTLWTVVLWHEIKQVGDGMRNPNRSGHTGQCPSPFNSVPSQLPPVSAGGFSPASKTAGDGRP